MTTNILGTVRSKPTVIGILAGWFLLIGVLSVLSMCGCYLRAAHVQVPRDHTAQDAATVLVTAACIDPTQGFPGVVTDGFIGSGVIIDDHHVLTALHVLHCPALETVTLELADGSFHGAYPSKTLPLVDLAMLETTDMISTLPPVPLAPRPQVGDTVCSAVAYPSRGHNCGRVSVLHSQEKGSDVDAIMVIVAGNSGGAVYDSQGRLAGIVTRRFFDSTGGQFTSLEGKDIAP